MSIIPNTSPPSKTEIVVDAIRRHKERYRKPPSVSDLYRIYLKRSFTQQEILDELSFLVSVGHANELMPLVGATGRPAIRYDMNEGAAGSFYRNPLPRYSTAYQKVHQPGTLVGCAYAIVQTIRRAKPLIGRLPTRDDLFDHFLKNRFSEEVFNEVLEKMIKTEQLFVIPPVQAEYGKPGKPTFDVNEDWEAQQDARAEQRRLEHRRNGSPTSVPDWVPKG